jgi:hypothetical protein
VAKAGIIEKYKAKGLSENLSKLYAMIDGMDREILRLLNEIDNLGLRENTIIIFMSDNGPAIINNWLNDEDREIRYAAKYKGHKGNIWENGVKSPLLISFNGHLIPSKIDMLCDVTDIFPTAAQLCGIDLTKYDLNLSGKSFAENLNSKKYERPDKFVFNYADHGWPPTERVWSPRGIEKEYSPLANNIDLLEYENQIISITSDNFKLLKNPSRREGDILDNENYVLVAIDDDTHETINVSSKYPDEHNSMKSALKERFEEILKSSNVFASPTFQISEGKSNAVPLYAPNKLHGNLENAAFYSYPWNETGSYAEFKYISKDNFVAQPVLIKSGNSRKIDYAVTINEITSGIRSNKENEIIFEDVFISEGEGIIRISVENSESNEEIEFNELRLINTWTKL